MDSRSPATVEPLTLEEYASLPEEDESIVELVRGRLVREPRPGARHGEIAGRIFYALETFVRERGGGAVAFEAGFLLVEDPPTVRGPDVAFIASERLPPGETPKGFWPLAPDLVVEVLSPSNRTTAVLEKVLEYLSAGTRLVWVVDPETESVMTYPSPEGVRVLTRGDVLDCGELLRGFRLDVAELFEA